MSWTSDYARKELEAALRFLPKDGYIITREEMERLVEALGGWQELAAVMQSDPIPAVTDA